MKKTQNGASMADAFTIAEHICKGNNTMSDILKSLDEVSRRLDGVDKKMSVIAEEYDNDTIFYKGKAYFVTECTTSNDKSKVPEIRITAVEMV